MQRTPHASMAKQYAAAANALV